MSSAANPYLALSAYVMAGLDGVRRNLDPGEPNLGNLYSLSPEEIRLRGIRILPQTLDESLAELKKDGIIQESLGVIYEEYIDLKEAELREFRRQVTPWEIDRYLTLF
jgi:glutamine synthetase